MALPIGPVVDATPSPLPPRTPLHGRYTSILPFSLSHCDQLYSSLCGSENAPLWTYMLSGPYTTPEQWETDTTKWASSTDPFFFTVLSGPESESMAPPEPVGMMSYVSITPAHRRLEIGSVIFGVKLQKTRAATEAIYLLIKRAFEELFCVRVEWKANALNVPSLAAAKRLGFEYEGKFMNHMIIKGRQRDTAWFAMKNSDWPVIKEAFEEWLDEKNFDAEGKQIRGLASIREQFKARVP